MNYKLMFILGVLFTASCGQSSDDPNGYNDDNDNTDTEVTVGELNNIVCDDDNGIVGCWEDACVLLDSTYNTHGTLIMSLREGGSIDGVVDLYSDASCLIFIGSTDLFLSPVTYTLGEPIVTPNNTTALKISYVQDTVTYYDIIDNPVGQICFQTTSYIFSESGIGLYLTGTDPSSVDSATIDYTNCLNRI